MSYLCSPSLTLLMPVCAEERERWENDTSVLTQLFNVTVTGGTRGIKEREQEEVTAVLGHFAM